MGGLDDTDTEKIQHCAQYLVDLIRLGNVLAFSLDTIDEFNKFKPLFKSVTAAGVILRITMNVTNKLYINIDESLFEELIDKCIEVGASQLTVRQITIPANHLENDVALETVKWINENGDPEKYEYLSRMINVAANHLIRTLPYGARVYDYRGIGVVAFDYCIQDFNDGENIRSLIFEEDGHLYTSWNSNASVLF